MERELDQRITALETDIAWVKKDLYGNGQAGVIKELTLKVTELEKQVIKIMTIATVIWTLLIGGHIALEQFFKK